ncbi:MAG: UV DNA damage repair endonuclease UvsE [Christensenellales bacterium]
MGEAAPALPACEAPRIGYACLALAVPGTDLKKCLIRQADEARLSGLINHNLLSLERMIDYNVAHGIRLFRISSDIIPFASSPVNSLPWWETQREQLERIGRKIQDGGLRVSMHPGQYTVLNSPNRQTAENAVAELLYHARFLDALGVDKRHKIILHVGGVYGDKEAALLRFKERWQGLAEGIKRRLVIENDDRSYHAQDVLGLGEALGIPVVFDNLHHEVNPSPDGGSSREWVAACGRTWGPQDGRQKIHYSQADPLKQPGAHSPGIAIDPFLAFWASLGEPAPDIMLEVKDKNLSTLKCILCTAQDGRIGLLEGEWARYKYLVLERSQAIYQQIRRLLKDKGCYPALPFYRLVEAALRLAPDRGSAINAAAHVWGYFKDVATPAQKKAFAAQLAAFSSGEASLDALKRRLYKLAEAYDMTYLLGSYYFLAQHASPQGEDEAG